MTIRKNRATHIADAMYAQGKASGYNHSANVLRTLVRDMEAAGYLSDLAASGLRGLAEGLATNAAEAILSGNESAAQVRGS
jgi:hypothetical protein